MEMSNQAEIINSQFTIINEFSNASIIKQLKILKLIIDCLPAAGRKIET